MIAMAMIPNHNSDQIIANAHLAQFAAPVLHWREPVDGLRVIAGGRQCA
jgi:hypothetical protein